MRGFLVSVKRSYIQQSSPGQREGLKGGFEERVDGWGLQQLITFLSGWVGLQKLITDLEMRNGYKGVVRF